MQSLNLFIQYNRGPYPTTINIIIMDNPMALEEKFAN
jgi:hypothetical protein